LAWVPLGFFFFTTFRGYVEANWPIVAYPVIFALAVASFPRNVRGLQITQAVWVVALVTMAALVLAQPSWSKNIKLKEFHQFDAIVERARGLEPMFARSYQMASKMHFELRVPVYKLKGMNRRDYYDSLRFSEPAPGTIYYLAAEKTDALPPAYRGDQVLEKIPVDERYEIWKVQRP
ncbi:MAG TPA: hypothetical protein PKC28_16455, partial [Bdellovibrionales bacterium]|nr:hypothetical protein [Bdellovibrionales bacterium]